MAEASRWMLALAFIAGYVLGTVIAWTTRIRRMREAEHNDGKES